MKPETEVYLVVALDHMITKLDRVLDELEDLENHQVSKAEHLIMDMTMELNGLIDRLTEEGSTKDGPSA